MLEREEGAASTLRQLGATVRTLDLWDDPVELILDDDDELEVRPRALVFEALDRPDLAVAALRAVRKEPYFDNVGALIAVTVVPPPGAGVRTSVVQCVHRHGSPCRMPVATSAPSA